MRNGLDGLGYARRDASSFPTYVTPAGLSATEFRQTIGEFVCHDLRRVKLRLVSIMIGTVGYRGGGHIVCHYQHGLNAVNTSVLYRADGFSALELNMSLILIQPETRPSCFRCVRCSVFVVANQIDDAENVYSCFWSPAGFVKRVLSHVIVVPYYAFGSFGVQGDGKEDDKDDADGDNDKDKQDPNKKDSDGEDEGADGQDGKEKEEGEGDGEDDNGGEGPVNDDLEDNYEDKPMGVEVRIVPLNALPRFFLRLLTGCCCA